MTTQDMTMNQAKPGWGDLLAGKNAIYALALAGGVTLHAVNIYIVTTILPSVVRDILTSSPHVRVGRRHRKQVFQAADDAIERTDEAL